MTHRLIKDNGFLNPVKYVENELVFYLEKCSRKCVASVAKYPLFRKLDLNKNLTLRNMLKVLDTRTRIPPGCKKKKDHAIKFRYLRPIFILLTKRT